MLFSSLCIFVSLFVRAESSHFGLDGLCSAPYANLDLVEAHQPLVEPPKIRPNEDGTTRVQLGLNLANYKGPAYNTIMRAYNGIAPGPTIHVQPGGTLEVELINCLHHEVRKGITLSHPNATNLRLHGPHVSGESPDNDIFETVKPQNSTIYTYKFDKNHLPGTHLYHPHFHGSMGLQVGHGLAGMLIVDDPEDYSLPTALKEMPEIPMVVQNINVPRLRDAANVSKDEVTNYIDHNFKRTNVTTSSEILMLVNMQFMPLVRMEVNKWYRWRMGLSSIDKTLAFGSDSEQCEFQLLAKDGIYLSAPRQVSVVILSPGNRADIAVRCSKIGREKMNTKSMPLSSNYGGFNPDMQSTFLEVDVVPMVHNLFLPDAEDNNLTTANLEAFNVPTPCYLVDLRGIDECHIAATFRNRFHCDPSPWSAVQDSLDLPGGSGVDTTDDLFLSKDLEIPVGTVQEITMTFAQRYPYHQQVNPFQIQAIHTNDESIEDFVSTWYQVGDWQDTLQFPHASLSSIDITIRFQADQFTGKMVEHCYMLDHEDSESKGVMAAFNIYGEEGTYWQEGRRVDPTCIEPARRTKFSSDSKSGKSKGSGSSTSKSNKSSKSKQSKSKQSKKGQSTSGETGNSTLFTSTNATNSVGSVSLYPTTVTPPSETSPDAPSASPITDVDTENSSTSSPSTKAKPKPPIFEPVTSKESTPAPTKTTSVTSGSTPTKELPNARLPPTPNEIDKKPPALPLEAKTPPTSAASAFLSLLSWVGPLILVSLL